MGQRLANRIRAQRSASTVESTCVARTQSSLVGELLGRKATIKVPFRNCTPRQKPVDTTNGRSDQRTRSAGFGLIAGRASVAGEGATQTAARGVLLNIFFTPCDSPLWHGCATSGRQ